MHTCRSAAGASVLGKHIYVVGKVFAGLHVYTCSTTVFLNRVPTWTAPDNMCTETLNMFNFVRLTPKVYNYVT